MKIFKKIKELFGVLSAADRERVELRRVSEVFGVMERMQRCGLLVWQEKDRRLFIAEPLAVVQLRSREVWDAFMSNIVMWTMFHRQSEAWDKCFTLAESKAIREARKKKAILRKDEIERIRRAARDSVNEDSVKVPKVEGFEIFIIRDNGLHGLHGDNKSEKSEKSVVEENAGSEIIAVGRYDAETERTDMVMWDAIKESFGNTD